MDTVTIKIVAALIHDETGRVLLVRKRGTRAFMQPGGKRAAGALHVLHHHGRVAGQVSTEMARDEPRIGVRAAADIESRDEAQRTTAVEFRDIIGTGRGGRGQDHRSDSAQMPNTELHATLRLAQPTRNRSLG